MKILKIVWEWICHLSPKHTFEQYLDNYSDIEFLNFSDSKVSEEFSLFPRRCRFTKKLVWFQKMYVVRFTYRGDWIIVGNIVERWYSREGFIWMRLLK